jgi:hypothetical protein
MAANSHVVRYLDEIVDLGASPDNSISNTASIYRRVRSYLYVVPDQTPANMSNRYMTVTRRRKCKANTAHTGSRLQHHPISQYRPSPDHSVRPYDTFITDNRTIFNSSMPPNYTVAPKRHSLPKQRTSRQGNSTLPTCTLTYRRARIHAPANSIFRHDCRHRSRERKAQIGHNYAGRWSPEFLCKLSRDQHCTGVAAPKVGQVAVRGKKCKIAGACQLQRGYPSELNVLSADQYAANKIGNMAGREARGGHFRAGYGVSAACRRLITNAVRSSVISAETIVEFGFATSKMIARFRSARIPSITVWMRASRGVTSSRWRSRS